MKSKPKKCAVCDWEIADKSKDVTIDGKTVTVCCDECAEKLRESSRKSAKR